MPRSKWTTFRSESSAHALNFYTNSARVVSRSLLQSEGVRGRIFRIRCTSLRRRCSLCFDILLAFNCASDTIEKAKRIPVSLLSLPARCNHSLSTTVGTDGKPSLIGLTPTDRATERPSERARHYIRLLIPYPDQHDPFAISNLI